MKLGHGVEQSEYMGTCQAIGVEPYDEVGGEESFVERRVISAVSDVRKGGEPRGVLLIRD